MSPPSISKTILTFLALTLALLAQNDLVLVGADHVEPILITTHCNPTSGNYSSGDAFHTNLGQVLTSMSTTSASSSPYHSNLTIGSGVDQVYGLYYCLGTIDASHCNACVMAAVEKIQSSCTTKEAIVWHLQCTLRYANRNIFTQLDMLPAFPVPLNLNLSAEGAKTFPSVLPTTIDGVISAAAFNATSNPPAFARAEAPLSSTELLVAVAQCSPVIVGATCNECLRAAMANMSTCCSNQVGALVFLPSCELLYAVGVPSSSSTAPNSNPFSVPASSTAAKSIHVLAPSSSIPTTPPTAAAATGTAKTNGSSVLRSRANAVAGVLGAIGFLIFMSFNIAF